MSAILRSEAILLQDPWATGGSCLLGTFHFSRSRRSLNFELELIVELGDGLMLVMDDELMLEEGDGLMLDECEELMLVIGDGLMVGEGEAGLLNTIAEVL